MVGASIMNMTYGIEDIGPNDPLVRIADDVVREFISALLPGSFWIDYISACELCFVALDDSLIPSDHCNPQ